LSAVRIELGGIALEWDLEALRALAGDDPERPWRLDGEPGWEEVEALRVISAAFEDGRALALASLLAAGAAGHGEALVGAALVDPEGAVAEIAEALVSTEYDAEGRPRRLGLELYPNPDSVPLRIAADRRQAEGERVALDLRLDGTAGRGLLETVGGA
jgi:hypothetical protein